MLDIFILKHPSLLVLSNCSIRPPTNISSFSLINQAMKLLKRWHCWHCCSVRFIGLSRGRCDADGSKMAADRKSKPSKTFAGKKQIFLGSCRNQNFRAPAGRGPWTSQSEDYSSLPTLLYRDLSRTYTIN